MNKTPLVTIILPSHNRSRTIAKSIGSVIQQDYTNWELIIIDDGSNDDTFNSIKDFLKDKRIKYVFQKNKGPSNARNKGISIAKGDLITFLDSDDEYVPKSISFRVREMLNQDISASLSNVFVKYPSKTIIKNKSKNRYIKVIDLLESNAGALISLMLKKDTLGNLRFDESLSVAEDVDLILRILQKEEIYFFSKPLIIVEKNLNGDRLSTNLERRMISHKKMLMKLKEGKYNLSYADTNLLYKKLYVDLGISYALDEKYSTSKLFFIKGFKIKTKLKDDFRNHVIYYSINVPFIFIILKYISSLFWKTGVFRA